MIAFLYFTGGVNSIFMLRLASDCSSMNIKLWTNVFMLTYLQAADIKVLGSLGREDLKKLCGDNYPEWISFPAFEQVIPTE